MTDPLSWLPVIHSPSASGSAEKGNTVQRTASNRSFGLLLAAICSIITAVSFWNGHTSYVWGCLALVFLAISLTVPRVLAPGKRLWLKLAELLSVVVSPIALGLMYVVAMIPVGVLIRLSGKDLLSLKREPSTRSYWIDRSAGGPAPESLKDQF
jgi:hypothetical protein